MKEATFRLHPAQQDVFIDQLINVDSPQYNIGGYIILKGTLNKNILLDVINTAPAFFDAFKLRFDANAPDLIGYINEDYTKLEIGEKDFSLEPEPAVAARAWMQDRLNRPFHLSENNCLFEKVLLKISLDEHWLFGRFHHLVMDGYGFIVWIKYMAGKYRSLLISEPVELFFPSYIEEAASANASLSDPTILANDNYWKEKIKARSPRLFHKKNVVAGAEVPASSYSIELTHLQRDQLESLAKASKAGVHQLTIAALLVYFGKLTAAKEFIFGLPLHKRNSAKLRKIIGLFNSFIPFSGFYNEEQTIHELIRTVSASQSVDYRHQDFSISSLGRHLQLNPAEGNLWEVIVNYLPLNFELDFGTDLKTSVFRLVNEYERTPLQVCWNDYGKQQPLELQIHFSKEYFDRAEIALFCNRLLYILSQFFQHQDKALKEISILPPEELVSIATFGRNKVSQNVFSGSVPYPDYLVQILDKNGQPAPIGVKGELCFSEDLSGDISRQPEFLNTGKQVKWAVDGEILLAEENEFRDSIEEKKTPEALPVNICASFVAEPLEEYINYWGNEFNLNLQVNFVPYNQVFQQLLDPGSFLNAGKGINILLLRVEDWLRDHLLQSAESQIAFLQETHIQFSAALSQAHKLSAKPYLAGIVSWVLNKDLDTEVLKTIRQIEQEIRQSLSGLSRFYELDLNQAIKLYEVEEIFDPKSDEVGHIPFADDFFAALGTYITRKIRALAVPAYKVIALDCDNTLWKGICGEVGPLNVAISPEYQYLQQFLLQKYSEGFLLVLCSKNNEEDVWEVFDNHPHMKLKREHIAAYKVNWHPKPANLQLIAEELNLATDSFIFLDDSAFEIEHMHTACSSVLSLCLPAEQENIPAFLEHTWAFDLFQVTEEDVQRNAMYNAEKQRKEEMVNYGTINDFILTLNVEVTVTQLSEKDLERAVQLSLRTNQFNLNGVRRSQDEISLLLADGKGIHWIVKVKDRFGDYGIVGLVLAKPENNTLILDTFLLSCRVLGRNVEDSVLDALVKYCNENGLHTIEARFKNSGKNKPFIEFLNRTDWILDGQTKNYKYPVKSIHQMVKDRSYKKEIIM